MRLDEIANEWDEVERVFAELDGEITPELADRLDALNWAEKSKVDSTIFYLKSLEGDCEALKKLEAEIAAKRASKLRRMEWLKGRVRFYMETRETTVLNGEVFRFQLVASGKPPVEVQVRVEDLPRELVEVSYTPKKEAIRQAILTQQIGPDVARLGQATTSLRCF